MQHIFLGDVQGCAEELEELLERVRAAFGDRFELWIVGDLINRGPHNLRVLRRVRELVDAGRARYVLGNHEIGLLLAAFGLRAPQAGDTYAEILEARDADDWIDWLRRRSLLESGRLGEQRFAMIHAAVHPDWDLAELERRARRVESRLAGPLASRFLAADRRRDATRDDLGLLTHCRSVSGSGKWSADYPFPPRRSAWHALWAAREHRYGVVYGHWAQQGLHVAPWLRGLDTGCVHHRPERPGALTAWLPDPESQTPFAVPDDRFWQVPAKRRYS